LRRATKNYRVIQLGLCTFHTEWKNKKPVYIAKPFNFYAFPREGGELGRKHANFMINSQSLVFLAEQGFDFNRLVRKGKFE
jgi:poly(A)-specific ribonuclease